MKRRELLRVGGVVALGALFLFPAVHTTFRFDDAVMYELRTGVLRAEGRTVADYVTDELGKLFSSGRAHPVGALLMAAPLTFSDHPTAYKTYLILTALVGAVLVYRLLYRLGMPRGAAAAGVVLFAALVQFRFYHDPMLGYSGVAQWTVILLASALLAWLRFEETGGRRWQAAAAVLWASCVLLYDANVTLLAVAVALVLTTRRTASARARGAAFFAVPVVLIAIAELVLRSAGSDVVPGYSPSFEAGRIASTYVAGLVGALPASYALWDPQGLMGGWSPTELMAGLWRGGVAGAVVALVAWHGSVPKRGARAAAVIGFTLWTAPGALLALAPKYQQELVMGQAYITVLPQVLGVSILLMTGVLVVASWAQRFGTRRHLAVTLIAFLAIGGASGLTGAANLRVVSHEQPMVRTRALLADALRAGVLRDMPEGSTIVGLSRDLNWYPYNYGTNPTWFGGVTLHRTDRRYDMRVDSALTSPRCPRRAKWPHELCELPAVDGGWLAVRPVRGGGAVIFGASPRGRVADPRSTVGSVVVFAQGVIAEAARPVVVGRRPDGSPWSSAGTVSWRVLGRVERGVLFKGVVSDPNAQPLVSSLDVPGATIDFVFPTSDPGRALGQRHLLP